MRIARVPEPAATWPEGRQTYEQLLERRFDLGRRRIDMLCHQDDPLEARAALGLHRLCSELDELLGAYPAYAMDRDLKVLNAEEPRFHRFPALPLDFEEQPCRACPRLLAEVIPELLDVGDLAPVSWGRDTADRDTSDRDAADRDTADRELSDGTERGA